MSAELSIDEKTLLCKITPETPVLDYRIEYKLGSDNLLYEVYDIPENDKADLLDKLYPFREKPSVDDTMYDLHEGVEFVVKEFIVIRYKNRNFIVSPHFLKTGGTTLDFIHKGQNTTAYSIRSW